MLIHLCHACEEVTVGHHVSLEFPSFDESSVIIIMFNTIMFSYVCII